MEKLGITKKRGRKPMPGAFAPICGFVYMGLNMACKMRKITSGIICLVMVLGVFGGTSVSAEGDPYVTHTLPQKMKIGDSLESITDPVIHFHNLLPGSNVVLDEGIDYILVDRLVFGNHSGDGPLIQIVDGHGNADSRPINAFLNTFYAPGIMTIQPAYSDEIYDEYEHGELINIGNPINITIVEPIITNNAPANVKAGSTLNLTTTLTNTSLTNKKVADYDNTESGHHTPAYRPIIEVIEGKDIVKQTNQDYSNTLITSETLTFNKTGTVKLKVTYRQINTCEMCLIGGYDVEQDDWIDDMDKRYNPEAIITINVADDSVSVTSSDPGTGIKLEANPGVVPPDTTLSVVKVTEGGNFTIINNALENAFDKWVAFDISLISEGAEIQPNGKIKITIPRAVLQGLNMNNMVLYHIAEDGTKTQISFTLDSTKDNIIFETNHFSLYALAEVELYPDTGDASSFVLMIALAMLSTTGLLFTVRKRRQ